MRTTPHRILRPAGLLAAGLLALTACSVPYAGSDSPKPVAPAAKPADPKAGVTLSAAASPALGTVVTDADGFTLYRFDRDLAKPSRTSCVDACATTWPPAVVTTGQVTVNGVDRSLVGTVLRPDGTRQLTIGGWPVYGFSKDTAQGEVKGQGVGGTWFAVTPTGAKNTSVIGDAESAPAPAGY
jgi:predicted lipoprotein with Yx(FWY)xxD motif